MESTITKRKMAVVLVASAVGLVGLTTAGIGLMWVAGALGISAAAASQIVDAIQAGGLALAIVSAIFGAGAIAAIIAHRPVHRRRIGRNAAIA